MAEHGSRPTATKNIGQITLKPINLSDVREVLLNADATNGSIHAELLNENGYRMRGFSKDDAVAITADSLHHPVRWKARAVAQLPPGQYMLRLHLENSEVFAITME